MARRKSVCAKWTLVLLVVVFCPSVYSRPQDSVTSLPVVSSTVNVEKDKPTENIIRYRYRHRSLRLDRHFPDLDSSPHVNITNNTSNSITNSTSNGTSNKYNLDVVRLDNDNIGTKLNKATDETPKLNSRKNRLVSTIYSNDPNIVEHLKHSLPYDKNMPKNINSGDKKNPAIKKVITKWTDNAKDEGFDFNYETSTSNENQDSMMFENSESNDVKAAEKVFHSQDMKKLYELVKKQKYKQKPQQSGVIQVYSDNVYVTDRYSTASTRPTYIFTTPTPTPIITNLGNPKPWSQPNYSIHRKPTTQRPIVITKPSNNQYNYHNVPNYPHYPGNVYEVTTFQPSNTYTDRIVIRPEEYAASPDECPTIFLTLNNTFQGQAKEACPDLNIAVNTNVVNKNVVVETEEEEEESDGFPDGFGLPFDESADEEGNDSYESDENGQTESGSIEELGLTNYNAPNAIQPESSEPAAAASHPISAIHKPGHHHHHRPGHHHSDDDDVFSFSSVLQFFKPAINAMNWLATINPFTFGLFSLILSPIMFLFAGTSGVAALFAPWAFSARESPKIVHIYRPQWHWDNELKTWQLHTFENDRWSPTLARSSGEFTDTHSGRPTFFYKLKEWMKNLTKTLREREKNKNSQRYRKNKRKKRETWTKRPK